MKRKETLFQAIEIAREYGGDLTVRQLYYQLVARGYISNEQRQYKRLVSLLSDARLAGDFPFEWLIDRTRTNHDGSYTGNQTSVASALDSAANELRKAPDSWLWRSRWWGQPFHVSVWVEKEALAGVFERPCDAAGVSWFVLRGYSSLSGLSSWVDSVAEAYAASDFETEEAVVLYFGDHDPDGWEIPRSAERNVRAIADIRGKDLPPVTFRRIALVADQIEEYSPPPFPAKQSSSRYRSYVEEHGLDDAWELDALRPEVLRQIITDTVDEYFDEDIYGENLDEIRGLRIRMRARMREPAWIEEALEDV